MPAELRSYRFVQISNVITDLYKTWYPVDDERATPVEIKSGQTMSTGYFDNLKYWRALTSRPEDQGYVVYGGEQSMQTSAGAFISWRCLERIPD